MQADRQRPRGKAGRHTLSCEVCEYSTASPCPQILMPPPPASPSTRAASAAAASAVSLNHVSTERSTHPGRRAPTMSSGGTWVGNGDAVYKLNVALEGNCSGGSRSTASGGPGMRVRSPASGTSGGPSAQDQDWRASCRASSSLCCGRSERVAQVLPLSRKIGPAGVHSVGAHRLGHWM